VDRLSELISNDKKLVGGLEVWFCDVVVFKSVGTERLIADVVVICAIVCSCYNRQIEV
jgi:hypothetical protein